MKKIILLLCVAGALTACKQKMANGDKAPNKDLAKVLDDYYNDRMKLFPLESTYAGDTLYNDLLPNDGSAEFLGKAHTFYQNYLSQVKRFNPDELNEQDKLSYDIFTYETQLALDGFQYHLERIPFNQFYALPLTIGQLGSGAGAQPFKTVKDYDNWLKRLDAFAIWADTAIANFNKGVKDGVVLPKSLVVKMIPEMEAMVTASPEQNLFYGPITTMPKTFSDADKKRLTEAYKKAIATVVVPTYKKLGDYLKNDYLQHSRATSGLSSLPNGSAIYAYLVKQQTTTDKTPEEIYQLGLKEVARIHGKMDSL